MKHSIFMVFLMGNLFYGCSDNTCKDPLALNLGIEDNCKYSKVSFYITSGQYITWSTLAVSNVVKSEIFVNGKSTGTITKVGSPNNCSAPGIVSIQLTSGIPVDWSNTVSLSNGNSITFSGTVEPSPGSPCITVRAD